MRVLVLGGDGFVGRHVVRALAASGWAEPITGRRRALQAGEQVETILVDACNRSALEIAISGVDAVVNCVAGNAGTIVRNAEALFPAAARAGVQVVHLSSMAVYGSATGTVSEDTPLREDGGAYAAAKLRAEQIAAAARGRVTIFRPGCIYGGESPQWSVRIARLLEQRRIGDLGAGGDGYSNLVHVADVAAAVLAALQSHPQPGVNTFNLSMPDAPDWNGYFLRLAKAIGAVPIARVPHWRMQLETRLLAPPLKILELISGGLATRPPIPASLGRLWRQDIRLNATRASQQLGLVWTPLDAGIAEAAAFYSGTENRRRTS